MIESCTAPFKGIDLVTDDAIFGKPGLCVIWICRCQVILPVAVNTLNTLNIENRKITGLMTLITVSRSVGPEQREPAHFMDPDGIVDKP